MYGFENRNIIKMSLLEKNMQLVKIQENKITTIGYSQVWTGL